ncbi:hypothetical protein [Nesterenkonia pannonica]|uniref:hypothetical protein n=1 Tax=Nesterenkonia pannonica TaxID=1548602 RepID=UPI0021643122|nr:hypothetical protein [Nesterenkonia pannonica]
MWNLEFDGMAPETLQTLLRRALPTRGQEAQARASCPRRAGPSSHLTCSPRARRSTWWPSWARVAADRRRWTS